MTFSSQKTRNTSHFLRPCIQLPNPPIQHEILREQMIAIWPNSSNFMIRDQTIRSNLLHTKNLPQKFTDPLPTLLDKFPWVSPIPDIGDWLSKRLIRGLQNPLRNTWSTWQARKGCRERIRAEMRVRGDALRLGRAVIGSWLASVSAMMIKIWPCNPSNKMN